jgi:adenosylhomocysteine nucleosidase
MTPDDDRGPATGPRADACCTLAFVTALELEAAPLRARLRDVSTFRPGGLTVSVGRLGRTPVAVVAGGVGIAAAARAARLVIDGHRPRRIVSSGLCGGLLPTLARDSVFVPDAVLSPDGSQKLPLEIPGCLRGRGLVTGGVLVSSEGVVCSPADKRLLHDRLQAAAVDMESFGMASEAAARGVRATVVRIVCDAVDDPSPEDIARLLARATGARQAGAALRLAWRRPSALLELAELRERAHVAAERLVPVLEALAAEEEPAP